MTAVAAAATASELAMCHCGHHLETHFDRRYACLAAKCECRRYIDASSPDDPADRAPETEPAPSSAGPLQMSFSWGGLWP